MPECTACRWCAALTSSVVICLRPKPPQAIINMSTGTREHGKHADLTCAFERSGAPYPIPTCGPEGQFFERR
jgi:hypothetical protein